MYRSRHDSCGDPFCECNVHLIDGRDGRDGRDGFRGRQGRSGRDGPTGPTGSFLSTIGPTGQQGPVGVQGPTGPAGISCVNTFLSIVRLTDVEVPQEVAVPFDTQLQKHGDIEFNAGGASIYVWRPGFYQINYILFPKQPAQFAVSLNGIVSQGSIVGASGGTVVGMFIFQITPADLLQPVNFPTPTGFAGLLQIINHTSHTPTVTLNASPGAGTQPNQIRASIVVNFLSPL